MLKPRECIAALEAYRSPITSRAGLSLDLNENAAGCSPRVLARLRALNTRDVALYPERDPGSGRLRIFWGCHPNQVLLTNGIDDGLYLLAATYLGSRDEMLFADPTFVMYPTLRAGRRRTPGAGAVGRGSGLSGRQAAREYFAAHAADYDRQS